MISNSCPFLRDLTILGLFDYTGTIVQLSHLESLDYQFENPEDYDMPTSYVQLTTALLPLNSAQTLKTLCVQELHFAPLTAFNGNPLDVFPKLNTLKIQYNASGINDIILNAKNVTLSTLEMDMGNVPDYTQKFYRIVTSPILASLVTFSLSLHVLYGQLENENAIEIPRSYIDALTANLKSVHTLDLYMGLDLSWRHYLSKMRQLRNLSWCVREVYGDELELEAAPGIRESIIAQAFEDTFSSFEETPKVSMVYICWG
jgi:hypothetical protein